MLIAAFPSDVMNYLNARSILVGNTDLPRPRNRNISLF